MKDLEHYLTPDYLEEAYAEYMAFANATGTLPTNVTISSELYCEIRRTTHSMADRYEMRFAVDSYLGIRAYLYGCVVTVIPGPVWRESWVPPTDDYFVYEPSDEPWCRYFGYGTFTKSLYCIFSRQT